MRGSLVGKRCAAAPTSRRRYSLGRRRTARCAPRRCRTDRRASRGRAAAGLARRHDQLARPSSLCPAIRRGARWAIGVGAPSTAPSGTQGQGTANPVRVTRVDPFRSPRHAHRDPLLAHAACFGPDDAQVLARLTERGDRCDGALGCARVRSAHQPDYRCRCSSSRTCPEPPSSAARRRATSLRVERGRTCSRFRVCCSSARSAGRSSVTRTGCGTLFWTRRQPQRHHRRGSVWC
jgi:hypothetical protein